MKTKNNPLQRFNLKICLTAFVVLGAFVACKPTNQTEKAPPAVQEKVSLGAVFPTDGGHRQLRPSCEEGN